MASEADRVGPEIRLPELFRIFPETRAIFNRYGLRGCGGDHGPAESLAFFAEAHGVPLERLLAEVRQVIRNPLLRRTVARQVSLRQVCRMKGVDLERFLESLQRGRRPIDPDGCDARTWHDAVG